MKKIIAISLFLVVLMLGGCTGPILAELGGMSGDDTSAGAAPSTRSADFSGDKAKFDVYVMSQCPYGTQVEDALVPVKKKFGDALDLSINFIADDLGGGNFRSLHGQNEVEGNKVQLCAKSVEGDKYLDLILCMNEDARSIPGNWESCSDKLGLDTAKIKQCYESDEAASLLSASIKASDEVGASASPTMYINGQAYNGGRESLDFQRAICAALDGEHEACKDMPMCASDADCVAQPDKIGACQNPGEKEAKCVYTEPVKTQVTVLNSEKCTSCDATPILGQLKQLFKGLTVKEVDVDSSEGKQLAQTLDISVVPAFFFDDKVAQTYTYKGAPQLASVFEKKDGGYLIKNQVVGSKWFIDDEKRTQFYQDIGVTKGDNRPQIDFFVMSYCPYGNQAEEAINGAFDKLGDVADFNPRWVVYQNYQGGGEQYCLPGRDDLCSMHGQQEINEDVRETCIEQMYGTAKFFDFAVAMNSQCTAQNADTCWKGVATSKGIDTAKVEQCFDDQAESITEESQKLGDKLGVQGSPTVFIDGEEYNGPRTAEGYTAALCAAFDQKPAECAGVPEPSAVQAAPSAAANIGAGCGV